MSDGAAEGPLCRSICSVSRKLIDDLRNRRLIPGELLWDAKMMSSLSLLCWRRGGWGWRGRPPYMSPGCPSHFILMKEAWKAGCCILDATLSCFHQASPVMTKSLISQRRSRQSVSGLPSGTRRKQPRLPALHLSFRSAIRCCHRLRMLCHRHWISTMATPGALNDGWVVVNWH